MVTLCPLNVRLAVRNTTYKGIVVLIFYRLMNDQLIGFRELPHMTVRKIFKVFTENVSSLTLQQSRSKPCLTRTNY